MTVVNTKGRYFRFPDEETLLRFIELYSDLFTPYADSYIKSDHRHALCDPIEYNMLKTGYIIDPYDECKLMIRVNLSKESLEAILKSYSFTKGKFITRKRSYYREFYYMKDKESV